MGRGIKEVVFGTSIKTADFEIDDSEVTQLYDHLFRKPITRPVDENGSQLRDSDRLDKHKEINFVPNVKGGTNI